MKMFEILHLESFAGRNVLKYYKTKDKFKFYSYEDLCVDSKKLIELLDGIKTLKKTRLKSLNDGDENNICSNIAVMLPNHSPALLAAIVG